MSGAHWEYQPEGSGAGHLQRVGSPGEYAAYTTSQEAYLAYQNHCLNCVECGETQCAKADELWQAYVAVRDGGDES